MKFRYPLQVCTFLVTIVLVLLFQSQESACHFITLRLSHKLSPSSAEFTPRGLIVMSACNPQGQHILEQNDLSDAERMELSETAKAGKNYVVMWKSDCGRIQRGVSYVSAKSLLDSNLTDQFVIHFDRRMFNMISYTIATKSTENQMSCTGLKFCAVPKAFNTSVLIFETNNGAASWIDGYMLNDLGMTSLLTTLTVFVIGVLLAILVMICSFAADNALSTWRYHRRWLRSSP